MLNRLLMQASFSLFCLSRLCQGVSDLADCASLSLAEITPAYTTQLNTVEQINNFWQSQPELLEVFFLFEPQQRQLGFVINIQAFADWAENHPDVFSSMVDEQLQKRPEQVAGVFLNSFMIQVPQLWNVYKKFHFTHQSTGLFFDAPSGMLTALFANRIHLLAYDHDSQRHNAYFSGCCQNFPELILLYCVWRKDQKLPISDFCCHMFAATFWQHLEQSFSWLQEHSSYLQLVCQVVCLNTDIFWQCAFSEKSEGANQDKIESLTRLSAILTQIKPLVQKIINHNPTSFWDLLIWRLYACLKEPTLVPTQEYTMFHWLSNNHDIFTNVVGLNWQRINECLYVGNNVPELQAKLCEWFPFFTRDLCIRRSKCGDRRVNFTPKHRRKADQAWKNVRDRLPEKW